MRQYPVALFVAITYAISWLIWSPLWWTAAERTPAAVWLIIAGGFGPWLAAIIVTAITAGRAGLAAWLRSLLVWRVHVGWYLVALLLPLAFGFAAYGLYLALGGAVPADWQANPWLVYPIILAYVFFLGGGQEEPGWRGFALPHLQQRYSALVSTLILGVIWAIWHLPLFFAPGSAQHGLPFGIYLLETMGAAFLYTWLFNSTGSVLLVMLLHAGSNAVANFIPFYATTGPISQLSAVVIVLWIVAALLLAIYGPKHLARRPRVTGLAPGRRVKRRRAI
jgi:membrane protease YdiL (CAAX protease family)